MNSPDLRPRTIVTTDSEADDMNSFMRLLYYTNELDVIGLVYTSSVHHWRGDGEHTLREARAASLITSFIGEPAGRLGRSEEATTWRWEPLGWMERLILDDYSRIYPNLLRHDPGYPSPAELWSRVAVGNVAFENDVAADTEGSDLIKAALLDDDPRRLYLQAWGGLNTIARALLSIEQDYRERDDWASVRAKVSAKAVIATIGQQDNAYPDYLVGSWPDIAVLDFDGAFAGYSSFSRRFAPPEILPYYRAGFWAANIKYGHGPVLAHYGLIGDGTWFAGEGDNPSWQPGQAKDPSAFRMFDLIDGYQRLDWTGEGDTPAFICLVPTGLRFLEDPGLGGWAGRLEQAADAPGYHRCGKDHNPAVGQPQELFTTVRWLPAVHNDFAARADWGVTAEFSAANHPPRVLAAEPDVQAGAGATVELALSASDPDGDELTAAWWCYQEASTVPGAVVIEPDGFRARVRLPELAEPGQRAVIVAAVTDNGTPALTRYAQFVITVRP